MTKRHCVNGSAVGGIRPQLVKRNRPGGKPPKGRPIQQTVPRFLVERAWAWLQRRFRRLVVR